MTKINLNTRFTLYLLTVLLPLGLFSQNFSYQYHKTKGIEPVGHFVPTVVQQKFAPVVIPREMPYPGVESDREKTRAIKDKGLLQALKINSAAKIGQAAKPQVLDTIRGNNYSGSVPNDDSFAINGSGKIVSMRNSTIGVYDAINDSVLFQSTLFLFYRPRPNIFGSKYDPRAIYDPIRDRYIILYLSGTTYQSSKIIVGFSKTSDPMDGFNIYQLDGNPLVDSTWSDYPHISLSKNDLFITANTFYNGSSNNSGYVQSTIRQVGLQAGYDSLPLTEHYYYNLKSGNRNLFNFTGITGGNELHNAPTYFLSNRNLDTINDSIFVMAIDDSAAGSPQMTMTVYTTENPYGLPPDARQANQHTFDCNDSRIQGGFFQNDRIQFVGNTMTADGNAGIYHGIIDISNPNRNNVYFKILGFDPIDIGYPQISYTGKSYAENEAIISFNHTGDSLNAGFSCLFFDNDSSYSDMEMIVEGQDYIDIIANSSGNRKYERWGDYTGAQPVWGDTGVVWASGYEASIGGQPLTAIAKLRSPNYNKSPIISLPEKHVSRAMAVSPNPSTNWFELKFYRKAGEVLEFKLVSLNGQLQKQEFSIEDYAYQGENTFRFRTSALKPGTYLLLIHDKKGQTVATEKIVIKR